MSSAPSDPPWTSAALPRANQLGIAGAVLFWLLLRPSEWVHRRVESVSFVDVATVRRRVSVDFTLPHDLPGVRTTSDEEIDFIPLTMLRKRRLTHFDVCDEAGTALPMLTAAQNGRLATAALTSLSAAILDSDVPADIADLLHQIATSQPAEAHNAYWRLLRAETPSASSATELTREPRLLTLAQELAANFIVLTAAEHDARRRIIKFAYDEQPATPRFRATIRQQLAWQPTDYVFRTPAAGDAGSYHFEAEAPAELEIVAASLQVRSPDGDSWNDEDRRELQRGHLYVAGAARGSQGVATLSLLPRVPGLLRSAILSTLFTAAVLSLARFRLSQLSENPEATTALLLLVPTILAAYVARPGEHGLVTEVLFALRFLVLLSGLCSFGAAGALLADLGSNALCWAWTTFALLAWAAFVASAMSWYAPRNYRSRDRI